MIFDFSCTSSPTPSKKKKYFCGSMVYKWLLKDGGYYSKPLALNVTKYPKEERYYYSVKM